METKIKAKKVKMTQVWKGENVVPVTILSLLKIDEEIPFKEGDLVHVSGYTKGKGFQGTVKRHGFHGGPKTHGQKNRHRAPGSIGSTAPQRVVPGRRMAGHMGTNKVTQKNLLVISIANDTGLCMVRGAVPGAIGGEVYIRAKQ